MSYKLIIKACNGCKKKACHGYIKACHGFVSAYTGFFFGCSSFFSSHSLNARCKAVHSKVGWPLMEWTCHRPWSQDHCTGHPSLTMPSPYWGEFVAFPSCRSGTLDCHANAYDKGPCTCSSIHHQWPLCQFHSPCSDAIGCCRPTTTAHHPLDPSPTRPIHHWTPGQIQESQSNSFLVILKKKV